MIKEVDSKASLCFQFFYSDHKLYFYNGYVIYIITLYEKYKK